MKNIYTQKYIHKHKNAYIYTYILQNHRHASDNETDVYDKTGEKRGGG